MVKLNNGKKSMNRLLWILLFVSTSVLWAWDMDESMVNGFLVKLDSVRCPTCEISRYVETPGYECESCAFYVKCKEKNVVYEFIAGPMGSFEIIDGVTVSYGKTADLKNCSVHFSFHCRQAWGEIEAMKVHLFGYAQACFGCLTVKEGNRHARTY